MFLRNLFAPREERVHPSKDTEWYRLLYGLEAPFTTTSGNTVTEDTAMGLTALWSAVTQISSAVASLPLHLYTRVERGKKKLTEDPRYKLMHTKPNPEQTSMVFRECQTGQLLLWGNCYAEQERDESGKLIALWPLLSKYIEVSRMPTAKKELIYKYHLPGSAPYFLFRDQILHIVGFSSQGLMGLNPVMKQRNSIGLGLALDEYAGRFFANGARPSAVLEHPLQLSQEAQDRLRDNWNKIHQGLSKSHRVAVLEEGMKLREFGFSAADAQTLESRRFSITDVARIFNMPPHMLKDLGNATFSNISNQGEDFVRYCLGPWLTRIEQHYSTQLLSDAEVEKVFFEHNAEGLLRGNISERYSSYATGRQWGWLSINDIREKENENPLEEGGDIYMVPLNMMPAEDVGKTPEFAPGGTPPKPGGTPGQGTENKTAGRSDEEDDEVAEDWQDPFDGRGSGNFGHAGRPGNVGGSAPSKASASYSRKDIEEAFGSYESIWSGIVNQSLRENSGNAPVKIQGVINAMDYHFSTVKPIDAETYRGGMGAVKKIAKKMGIEDEFAGINASNFSEKATSIKNKLVGVEFVDRAFVSSTKDIKIAADFAEGSTGFGNIAALFKITGKSKIVDVGKVSGTNSYKYEQEFLHNRGTRFKIKNVDLLRPQSIVGGIWKAKYVEFVMNISVEVVK